MAAGSTYTVNRSQIAAHDKLLVAGNFDTVLFLEDVTEVEVLSDGVAAIYVCTDGNDAAVSGPECYKIPGGAVTSVVLPAERGGGSKVSLISAGAPTYSVTKVG